MLRHWLLVAELEDLFKGRKRHEGEGTWRRKDGSEWRYGADGKPERVKKGRQKEPKPAAEPKPKARRKRGAADVKLPTYPSMVRSPLLRSRRHKGRGARMPHTLRVGVLTRCRRWSPPPRSAAVWEPTGAVSSPPHWPEVGVCGRQSD